MNTESIQISTAAYSHSILLSGHQKENVLRFYQNHVYVYSTNKPLCIHRKCITGCVLIWNKVLQCFFHMICCKCSSLVLCGVNAKQYSGINQWRWNKTICTSHNIPTTHLSYLDLHTLKHWCLCVCITSRLCIQWTKPMISKVKTI